MGRPAFLPEVIHLGKFLPSRPFTTSAEPEKRSGECGGSASRLTPDVALSLLGGPTNPRAQHGLCMMQIRPVWLKQKLQSSVIRVPLHLLHALLSIADVFGASAGGGPENLDMSRVLRSDVLGLLPLIAISPDSALGCSGVGSRSDLVTEISVEVFAAV